MKSKAADADKRLSEASKAWPNGAIVKTYTRN